MVSGTALDDVEFLARSGHRVAVLEALAAASLTRRKLHEETGVSQPTLGRILGDFEDREWVERDGQTYGLTPFGRVLADQFGELLGTIETMRRFRQIAPHLPLESFGFDLRAFEEATITVPRTDDVFVHVRRMEALITDADTVRILSPSIHPQMLGELADRLEVREQFHEAILHETVIEMALGDPELASLTRRVVASDQVTVYRYDGAIPLAMAILDDLAILIPLDDHNVPCALVETENDAIRTWIATALDDYRERSTELTLDDFPE